MSVLRGFGVGGLALTLSATILVPSAALAGDIPMDVQLAFPTDPLGSLQTALKTGDTLHLSALVLARPDFSVTADLAPLALPPLSTSVSSGPYTRPIHGVFYPNVYEYALEEVAIPLLSDGTKVFSASGENASGDVGSTTASVVIDNTPPAITLTDLSFSSFPPREGDTMYFSGRIDGTGSEPHAHFVREVLLDASGNPILDGGSPAAYEYDTFPLRFALASSPDGAFTNVPITLNQVGTTPLSSATSFRLEVGVYDGAGNTGSGSNTVPLSPVATTTGVSNVLFIPGTEASRLYMRSGFQERQLWEPSIWTDIPELALYPDGTSVNEVYTKDIVGDLYDNTLLGDVVRLKLGDDAKIYGDFVLFMDSLVASSTLGMRQWRAYPYDWRYDPRDVVEDGTLTKLSDGSLAQVYLENVLDTLASSSATGKVTIVAHSNGGLVAKALIEKLVAEGKADKIDRLITIGTPAWGTPTSIGVMLHGDGQNYGAGLVAYAPQVRAAAAAMPGPHVLLPSSTYFAHVEGPVATFTEGGMSQPFHNAFPGGIRSWSELTDFASDAFGLDASVTDPDALNKPFALSPSLLAKARATHDALDSWTPPAGLEVTSIAGWGQLTVYRYDYAEHVGHVFCLDVFQGFSCTKKPQFIHTPKMTEDGDGTVVSPSATGGGGGVWYFNAQRFNTDHKGNIVHGRLTSADPIQRIILRSLRGEEVTEDYVGDIKPTGQGTPLTLIGAESPVNLLVTDGEGNETGLVPISGLEGLYFKKQGIPGSAVEVSGENKFVTLPAGPSYSVVAIGYASGPATLFVENLDSNGVATASTTLVDIPVATSTTISLAISTGGVPSSAEVDLDADGTTDATIVSGAGGASSLNPLDYLTYMQGVVAAMPLDPKVAKQLQIKLENVEHVLRHDGQWDPLDTDLLSTRVGKKIDQVAAYINKADIAPDLAAEILAMLTVLRSLTFGS
jgi:pimeloyl-ACP methyl ester carboxylesterase